MTLSRNQLIIAVITLFLLGVFTGALLNRYELVVVGEYGAMKMDRLTGKTWMRNHSGYGANTVIFWVEVKHP